MTSNADLIDYRELTRLVVEGVRSSVASLRPNKPVNGFALCTDDDLTTLFAAACIEDGLPTGADAGYRFDYNDWPETIEGNQFQLAEDLLRIREARDPKFEGNHSQLDRAFEALVAALEAVRLEKLFEGDVFLAVGSTDPGPQLERWASDAVLRLNSAETIRAWRTARLVSSQEWLQSIRSKKGPRSWADQDNEKELQELIARLEVELGS